MVAEGPVRPHTDDQGRVVVKVFVTSRGDEPVRLGPGLELAEFERAEPNDLAEELAMRARLRAPKEENG